MAKRNSFNGDVDNPFDNEDYINTIDVDSDGFDEQPNYDDDEEYEDAYDEYNSSEEEDEEDRFDLLDGEFVYLDDDYSEYDSSYDDEPEYESDEEWDEDDSEHDFYNENGSHKKTKLLNKHQYFDPYEDDDINDSSYDGDDD